MTSESLFNNAADLQACTFIKKRILHRYCPVSTLRTYTFYVIFKKFFKKSFF